MSLSSFRNPMQAHKIDLVGVGVNIEVKGHRVKLALDVVGADPYEVMNELEVTNFINLETLPEEQRARKAIYAGLLTQLDTENGKHYIAINPLYSSELVDYINTLKPGYTDTLVKKTNLLFSDIEQKNTLKELPEEYKIEVLKNIESEQDADYCAAIAKFQKEGLIAMRPSLPDNAALKKMDERYSKEAIIKKTRSGKIIILIARKGEEILATMVLNSHSIRDKSLSDKTVYMSDLIISKNLINNDEFVMQFMASSLRKLPKEIPSAKIFTFMAPGDSKDPLVSRVEKAKEAGLYKPLDKKAQVELGLVPYFVQALENDPKHNITDTPANFFKYQRNISSGTMVTLTSSSTRKSGTETRRPLS